MKEDKCEWCGMTYPKGGWLYWEIHVFKDYHKICDDCKIHLKMVEAQIPEKKLEGKG